MKRNIYKAKSLLMLCLGIGLNAFAGSPVTVKIPISEDADLFSRQDQVSVNYGDEPNINPVAWTWNADQLGNGVVRSLLRFSMNQIPKGAEITSAKLNLFSSSSGGLSGGTVHAGSNAAWISKVTDGWGEMKVTWNTQPAVSTSGRIAIPASTSGNQNYIIDITSLTKSLYDDPRTDFGLMISLQNEEPHRQLLFASSEFTTESLRPFVEITYTLPCVSNELLKLSPTADADVFSRKDQVSVNRGTDPKINPVSWTWTADGLGDGTTRSLIRFDYTGLPEDATINSAVLKLFYANTGGLSGGNVHVALSGDNSAYLSEVTESWAENTVTWNNQPAFSTTGQLSVPASSSGTQNYELNVIDLVKTAISEPDKNFGFILRLQNEVRHRQLLFGSKEFPEVSKRPVLEITYSTCVVTTATEDVKNNKALVGPNPFNAFLNVNTGADAAVIELYNFAGQIVNAQASDNILNTSELTPGMYIVKVIKGEKVETFKVVKQ